MGDRAVALTAKEGATRAAARRRAAAEVVARYEGALRRTASRYSLSPEDAEDAFQRAMEILVVKAPSTDPAELIRWTQTVTKNEALALRRSRKKSVARLARPPRGGGGAVDWAALVPAEGDGPYERAEQREALARSREALRALRPAERRALGLLAGGCSYAEIERITGFSPSKVNRSIAEGRERFRRLLARGEDGSRCEELRPLLSAFCDGEASPEGADTLREHLRACGPCRAAMRSYRAVPRAVAALAPAPFGLVGLLGRLREVVADLQARLPGGGGGDSALAQAAGGGGAKGAGAVALAKAAAVCAGTAGGAAACVAAGVVPAPFGIGGAGADRPAIERGSGRPAAAATGEAAERAAHASRPGPSRRRKAKDEEEGADAGTTPAEAVEYAPPTEASSAPPPAPAPQPAPAPAPPPATAPPSSSGGNAAGEFGP